MRRVLLIAGFGAAGLACRAQSIVSLTSVKDNTVFEATFGTPSDGAGPDCFAGATAGNGLRRALVQFDLSGVPPGASINSAVLTLWVTRTRAPAVFVTIHRAAATWGEGTGGGGGFGGGAGSAPTPGDATWLHRFYPDVFWGSAGGDFAAEPSAVASVGGDGPYDWSGPGLLADVQGWVADPASNAGWFVVGDEVFARTAKRFATRENIDAGIRPRLVVGFGPRACYPNCDGSTAAPALNVNDFACFLNAFAAGNSYANCDGSTSGPVLNVNDFACFLDAFAAGCS